MRHVVLALVLGATGCGAFGSRKAPSPPPAPAPAPVGERLTLDPDASPIGFRWLDEEAVLVDPGLGKRSLANFGNYVERAAGKLSRTRLTVWDDEAAWRSAPEAGEEAGEVAHMRAEYLKSPEPNAVDQFTVFNREGKVVYQRDFRDWPLTDTD